MKSDQSRTNFLAVKPSALSFLRRFHHRHTTITTSSPPPQHPQQAAEGATAILQLLTMLSASCGSVCECEKASCLRGGGAACLLHLLIALALHHFWQRRQCPELALHLRFALVMTFSGSGITVAEQWRPSQSSTSACSPALSSHSTRHSSTITAEHLQQRGKHAHTLLR